MLRKRRREHKLRLTVQKIERLFTKELILRSLSLGLGFALVEFLLKITIHAAFGQYGAFDYTMGALVGFFSNFLIGALLALPLALRPSLGFISYALLGLFLVYDAFAYLIHADTGHIPTLEALFAQLESADGGFYLIGLTGGVIALLGAIGLAALFERRFSPRYENVRVRIADAVTVFIFGALGFLTLIGGVGPVYYGTVPPLFHLASGREPTDPDPSVNLPHSHHHHHAHDHEHHRHEHGFVPDEKREPFPEDGIPRPVESMRLQYQGLLGSENFLPIGDTAYPYCRDEVQAGEASRPHDLIVVDLAGLDREALGGALDALLGDAHPRAELKHFYTVSINEEAGRRALLSGIPPLVPRAFVQPVRGLPSAALLPRLPSLAEELRKQATIQTAYFGPAKPVRGEALPELKLYGFDRLSFAESGDDSVKIDLESLKRLEMYYFDRSRGPKFAYIELASTKDGQLNEEVREALGRVLRSRAEASVILTSAAPRLGDDDRPETRLSVPFIVRSPHLDADRIEVLKDRLGSSLDLPQTVLGLIGAPRSVCFQGRDLLGLDEEFPSRRVVLSELAAGAPRFAITEAREHGEERFVWVIDGSDPLNRETPAKLFDPKLDPAMRSDLFSRRDPDWPQLDEFWKSHLAIGAYLLRTDRFVPPPRDRGVAERREAPEKSTSIALIDEAIPNAAGSYLYELSSKDRAKNAEALSARARAAELTLELRAELFDNSARIEEQLEAMLGAAYRPGDAILANELALALAFDPNSARKIGFRLPFDADLRLGYLKKLRELGIDFVYLSLPSDSLIDLARSVGLETWTTKAGALLLESRQPDRIIE